MNKLAANSTDSWDVVQENPEQQNLDQGKAVSTTDQNNVESKLPEVEVPIQNDLDNGANEEESSLSQCYLVVDNEPEEDSYFEMLK